MKKGRGREGQLYYTQKAPKLLLRFKVSANLLDSLSAGHQRRHHHHQQLQMQRQCVCLLRALLQALAIAIAPCLWQTHARGEKTLNIFERNRQTNRQTDGQTNRQTQDKTDKTDREGLQHMNDKDKFQRGQENCGSVRQR